MEGFSMCAQKLSSLHARGNEYSHAEHTVLAYWLGQQTEPVPAAVDEACRELGFGEPPLALYTSADAAVADILLDDVAHDLFWSWAIERSQQNVMRELFKIDWASSSDIYNWPVIYQVIWVPFFARYLVVASAAWPDAHGYADLAIGSFEAGDNVAAVANVIQNDWSRQRDEGQSRWVHFVSAGLINEATATKWADQVWPLSVSNRPKEA